MMPSHPDAKTAPREDDLPEIGSDGTPIDSPGTSAGTAGTDGTNKVQEELDR